MKVKTQTSQQKNKIYLEKKDRTLCQGPNLKAKESNISIQNEAKSFKKNIMDICRKTTNLHTCYDKC